MLVFLLFYLNVACGAFIPLEHQTNVSHISASSQLKQRRDGGDVQFDGEHTGC